MRVGTKIKGVKKLDVKQSSRTARWAKESDAKQRPLAGTSGPCTHVGHDAVLPFKVIPILSISS